MRMHFLSFPIVHLSSGTYIEYRSVKSHLNLNSDIYIIVIYCFVLLLLSHIFSFMMLPHLSAVIRLNIVHFKKELQS